MLRRYRYSKSKKLVSLEKLESGIKKLYHNDRDVIV
jgi:hypothetical protein